jgi:mono/diheme cytochrome c family protein
MVINLQLNIKKHSAAFTILTPACALFFFAVFGPSNEAQAEDFVHEVVPVLKRNCAHCHGGNMEEGGFSLNTREAIVDSGLVDLDAPEDSYLLELITSDDPDLQMPPPDRPRMSAKEIQVLRRWVEGGLKWEGDFTFAIQAYEPPLRPRQVELPAAIGDRQHPVDRLLDDYLAERQIPTPQAIDDETFLRRVSLDLSGMLPSEEQRDAFLSSRNSNKRTELIDSLLDDEISYADHWMSFFNDLLRNDYSGTGFITGGRKQISLWLYESLRSNKPFDVMVRELVAPPTKESQGFIDGIKWRGEVSAGQSLPIQFSQSISQSFLGINMKCASCHDSFVDRWKLSDAYGLAAIYSDSELELHRCDKPIGEFAKAAWLFPELGQVDPEAPRSERLQQLAELLTHRENGRFARTIVNRIWYQLMGRGIVHPLDAMQSEPWNEDLLDFLANELVRKNYDLKEMLRLIATSAAYQSESEVTSEDAVNKDYVYRGPRTKRMTAEQFLDNVWKLTDSAPKEPDFLVRRGGDETALELTGQWIWGPLEDGIVPGQQSVLLRKTLQLPASVTAGGAVVYCDNTFQMYVNGKRVSRGDDWTEPQAVLLDSVLKEGENVIVIHATNEGKSANPAGLFLQARLELSDGSTHNFQSDQTWDFNPNVPTQMGETLGSIRGRWQAATVVAPLKSWMRVVNETCLIALAEMSSDAQNGPMVRASLVKNTALMKSLGRPMREQIVSMRPDRIATLEAIDLANEPTLAKALSEGAETLLEKCNGNPEQIVQSLFRATLCREPSKKESMLLTSVIGDQPDRTSVQDAMWAICMLPEFFIIR